VVLFVAWLAACVVLGVGLLRLRPVLGIPSWFVAGLALIVFAVSIVRASRILPY